MTPPEREAAIARCDAEIKTPPCQEILDAQGFLILADFSPKKPGTVLPNAYGGAGYAGVPGPLLVIAPATFEEWAEQAERFAGLKNRSGEFTQGGYTHFYKVIAE